ncbi:DUF2071 domain-containing protein [Vitreoscilla stercoraria]|uniref:DUF2071 domain-containing protein n=2 Tax=Vitreoscilla stercoraria TaxID=61 RepID=A0ABY4EDB6_VITST|nr:DUF2071 domain-containing protein [Vitreoscilla stercoraria]UOO93343.1 DUF2071 domain-containing protein [Vitreoscilla stercoraria]
MMTFPILKFKDYLHPRPEPKKIDVSSHLQHFALITYALNPERFKDIIPPRFKLDTIEYQGQTMALMSVVPFHHVDFTSAVYPFAKFNMGQIYYRVYVIDQHTQERCVWFLGAVLDSWTLIVPRYLWQLPWHPGNVHFECKQNTAGLYDVYNMNMSSSWGCAEVSLTQNEEDEWQFEGFPNQESYQVFLTHPMAGFYHRRDGQLGTYRVWHDKLCPKPAHLIHVRFELLERLQLLSFTEQQNPYSVMIEPINAFTVYLPPKVI